MSNGINRVESDEIDLRELFLVVWKRRGLILLLVIIISGLTAAFSLTRARLYTARARVMAEEDIGTHRELLKSQAVMVRLEEKTGVDIFEDIEFDVERVQDTPILDLKVSSGDPETARSTADTWVNAYLRLTAERLIQEHNDDIKKLRDEIEGYERELAGQSETITLRKSITDEGVLMRLAEKEDIWDTLTGNIIIREEVNPIHNNLKSKVSGARTMINSLESGIRTLESFLESIGADDPETRRDIGMRVGDVRLASYSGRAEPEGRGAVRNTALALVLSLFIGILLAFFAEFITSLPKESR